MTMFDLKSLILWFSKMLNQYKPVPPVLMTGGKSLSKLEGSSDQELTTWNGLPDVAIKKIFEKLIIGDRVRMMRVSKSWKQILSRDDIPIARDRLPWFIEPRDSLSTQISIRSISEDRVYFFDLPKFYGDVQGGWFCGCSNGWLVILVGPPNNLKRQVMFLWNPISGTTRKLPPLSTLSFIGKLAKEDIVGNDNLSSFIKRVEVFSEECIVAVIFSSGGEKDYLAFSTPRENKWSTPHEGYYNYLYNDISFHDGKLYALAQTRKRRTRRRSIKKENYTIHLTYTKIEVCMLFLNYKLSVDPMIRYDEEELNCIPFNITNEGKISEYLVESSTTGELLVVTAIIYSYKYNNMGGPVKSFSCYQTKKFEVRKVDSLESVLELAGERIYVGSTSSLSIPTIVHGRVRPNSIAFSTDIVDDGCAGDENIRVVREFGLFYMQNDRMNLTNVEYFRSPVHSKTGWFVPKLF